MRGRLWVTTVLAVVSTLGFALPTPARAAPPAGGGGNVRAGPVPAARAFILVDADSGAVLAAQAQHDALPPASTTKLMTALVALEKLPAEAVFVVDDTAAAQPAMRIGMRSGQGWALSPTLHSLLMVSANDAAYALAEAASGSLAGFAADMNATAARYGMRDSVFNDPAGFDDSASFQGGSRVSAYDLAVAARNFLAVPELAAIAAMPEYAFQEPTGRPHHLRNHNKLLRRYPGAIGLKTGYTRQAGHTFVGAARRDGRTMIAVVLDTDDTYGSAAALMDFGFATARDDPGIGEQVPAPAVRPYVAPMATTLVQNAAETVKEDAGGGRWLSRLTLMLFASTGGVVTLRRRAEQRRRARAERRRQVADARRREFQRLSDPEGWDAGCRVEVPRSYELL
jgi:D-alanyl-D-alanine carboxypeptidase (penicillin-binding protein 5/6)